jgi:hypothetical protein
MLFYQGWPRAGCQQRKQRANQAFVLIAWSAWIIHDADGIPDLEQRAQLLGQLAHLAFR